MAEEHRCQAPQLCANNCGFFGNPSTQNFCSKCYRDVQLKEQQSSSAKQALNQTLSTASTSSQHMHSIPSSPAVAVTGNEERKMVGVEVKANVHVARPNRCSTCNKRVGLTGFKCRCEMVFCGSHRYPENHGCSFDFKAMGKDQIAKANPVIKAEKLDKI